MVGDRVAVVKMFRFPSLVAKDTGRNNIRLAAVVDFGVRGVRDVLFGSALLLHNRQTEIITKFAIRNASVSHIGIGGTKLVVRRLWRNDRLDVEEVVVVRTRAT